MQYNIGYQGMEQLDQVVWVGLININNNKGNICQKYMVHFFSKCYI